MADNEAAAGSEAAVAEPVAATATAPAASEKPAEKPALPDVVGTVLRPAEAPGTTPAPAASPEAKAPDAKPMPVPKVPVLTAEQKAQADALGMTEAEIKALGVQAAATIQRLTEKMAPPTADAGLIPDEMREQYPDSGEFFDAVDISVKGQD